MSTTTASPAETASHPEAWMFDKHGDTVAGTFLRWGKGYTKNYGSKPLAILQVDGIERSVWLSQTVLHSKFEREVRDRPAQDLNLGERIVVTRLGKKQPENGGQPYWDFDVLFPDKPAPAATDLFDLSGPTGSNGSTGHEEAQAENGNGHVADDDGIPF